MPIYIRQALSGSDKGLPILVTGTSSAGAFEVHRVQATATNVLELVTVWTHTAATAHNTGLDATFILENSSTNTQFKQVLFSAGNQAVSVKTHPRLILNAVPLTATSTAVSAFATATSGFYVHGYIDRIATG